MTVVVFYFYHLNDPCLHRDPEIVLDRNKIPKKIVFFVYESRVRLDRPFKRLHGAEFAQLFISSVYKIALIYNVTQNDIVFRLRRRGRKICDRYVFQLIIKDPVDCDFYSAGIFRF